MFISIIFLFVQDHKRRADDVVTLQMLWLEVMTKAERIAAESQNMARGIQQVCYVICTLHL
jgi:hypothetical protein